MIDLSKWRILTESSIDGNFNGFDSEMIFPLQNSTFYYQAEYKYHYYYAYCPQVKILEGSGGQYIYVEGMNDHVRVEKTTVIRSRIISEFNGWTGNTIFELQNGQIWKQDNYQYKYFYAYRPEAVIARIGSKNIMTVKGRSIRVKRLK